MTVHRRPTYLYKIIAIDEKHDFSYSNCSNVRAAKRENLHSSRWTNESILFPFTADCQITAMQAALPNVQLGLVKCA